MRQDRRTAARLRLAFPVLIEGPFGIRRCVARDVSGGGLFVETSDPYAPGTAVRVTFALPDGSWEMSASCRVRHVVRIDASDGMLHGVGLAFDPLDDDAAAPGVPPRRPWA